MYDYKFDKMPYEKYRDGDRLFEIKKHTVKDYYPHFHYATEICCVIKGKFFYTINGNWGEVEQGDILFINPGEMHQYFESNSCEVVICIMSEIYASDFTLEFGDSAFDNLLKNKVVNAEVTELLEAEFDRQKTNYYIENKVLTNKVYGKLCRTYPLKKHESADMLLNKILEFVYFHYKEPLTVEMIAEQFSYSPVTISKMFQKKIHVDFRVFLNNVRSDMAHKLLNDPKYKEWQLIQIVYECGFNSMATFYRSYKRRYNTLPKKFGSS